MRIQDLGEMELAKSPVWENFGHQTTVNEDIDKSGAFCSGCLARFTIHDSACKFFYIRVFINKLGSGNLILYRSKVIWIDGQQ